MYEALGTGNMVCSEDIAVVLARERRDTKVKGVSNKHLRVVVSTMMKEVSQDVSDVCDERIAVALSEKMDAQHLCAYFPRTSMSTY